MKGQKLDSREVEELYIQGKTDAQIAQILGVKKESIRDWRAARRLPSNDVKRRADLSNLEKDAIAAREMGLTYGQYKAIGYRQTDQPKKKSKKRV